MITLSILINVFLQMFFPFEKNEERCVLYVDTNRLPIIDGLFCKTSALDADARTQLGNCILGCVQKAMKDCGFRKVDYRECRLQVIATALEFKDSASALMNFIQNFTSKRNTDSNKLKEGDMVSVFPSSP
jgi:hypothetical protein